MSRLDQMINRLVSQRASLEAAKRLTLERSGIGVEFGLGKGRTFDHLREILPSREIYVFDRELSCEPEYAPPERFRVFGELSETLPTFATEHPAKAVLIHSDIGTSVRRNDTAIVDFITQHIIRLAADGAIVASDRPMFHRQIERLADLPPYKKWQYYLYRFRA